MNTAVLTGRQVYKAMKVFIVSQSGKVADITLQSSCHSEDESVIKVSPIIKFRDLCSLKSIFCFVAQVSTSCSSVYVDGTETEGSSNASIIIKYGSTSGLARFTVWMPEYPLEVFVTDYRLSQIKGWKIPVDSKRYVRPKSVHRSISLQYWGSFSPIFSDHGKEKRRKRANNNNNWYKSSEDLSNGPDRQTCRARYQQTPIEIYARFIAVDQVSFGERYLYPRTEFSISICFLGSTRVGSVHF